MSCTLCHAPAEQNTLADKSAVTKKLCRLCRLRCTATNMIYYIPGQLDSSRARYSTVMDSPDKIDYECCTFDSGTGREEVWSVYVTRSFHIADHKDHWSESDNQRFYDRGMSLIYTTVQQLKRIIPDTFYQ